MLGRRAVSTAGLCRRQQAGRMAWPRTGKAPRSDKTTKAIQVPKGPVCVCVHLVPDIRAAATSHVRGVVGNGA